MPLSDTIKTLIRNAWDDGYPCLVSTYGPHGPNLTPKGSMIVYDDAHLAWWERSKRAVLENLSHEKRVCIMYANFKAQRDGVLESGFLRFFGTVALYEDGPVRRRSSRCSCRASRRMRARRPASACWSGSRRRSISGASRLCNSSYPSPACGGGWRAKRDGWGLVSNCEATPPRRALGGGPPLSGEG